MSLYDDYDPDRKAISYDDYEPEPSLGTRLGNAINDIGVTTLKSAVGVPELALGLADIPTGGRAGKFAQDLGFDARKTKEYLDTLYSPAQKQANQNVRQAEGFVPTLKAYGQNPSTLFHDIGEQALPILTGGGISRGLRTVAPNLSYPVAGAAGEALVTAGQNLEQVRQESPNQLLDFTKQTLPVLASSALTGGIAAGSGKLAQRLGYSDPENLMAGAVRQAGTRDISRLENTLASAGLEGITQELPQSFQEQIATNYATGKPLEEGLGQTAAQGLLLGGALGGATGFVEGPTKAQEKPSVELEPQGPLTRAASKIPETVNEQTNTSFVGEQGSGRSAVDQHTASVDTRFAPINAGTGDQGLVQGQQKDLAGDVNGGNTESIGRNNEELLPTERAGKIHSQDKMGADDFQRKAPGLDGQSVKGEGITTEGFENINGYTNTGSEELSRNIGEETETIGLTTPSENELQQKQGNLADNLNLLKNLNDSAPEEFKPRISQSIAAAESLSNKEIKNNEAKTRFDAIFQTDEFGIPIHDEKQIKVLLKNFSVLNNLDGEKLDSAVKLAKAREEKNGILDFSESNEILKKQQDLKNTDVEQEEPVLKPFEIDEPLDLPTNQGQTDNDNFRKEQLDSTDKSLSALSQEQDGGDTSRRVIDDTTIENRDNAIVDGQKQDDRQLFNTPLDLPPTPEKTNEENADERNADANEEKAREGKEETLLTPTHRLYDGTLVKQEEDGFTTIDGKDFYSKDEQADPLTEQEIKSYTEQPGTQTAIAPNSSELNAGQPEQVENEEKTKKENQATGVENADIGTDNRRTDGLGGSTSTEGLINDNGATGLSTRLPESERTPEGENGVLVLDEQAELARKTVETLDKKLSEGSVFTTVPKNLRKSAQDLGVYDENNSPEEMLDAVRNKIVEYDESKRTSITPETPQPEAQNISDDPAGVVDAQAQEELARKPFSLETKTGTKDTFTDYQANRLFDNPEHSEVTKENFRKVKITEGENKGNYQLVPTENYIQKQKGLSANQELNAEQLQQDSTTPEEQLSGTTESNISNLKKEQAELVTNSYSKDISTQEVPVNNISLSKDVPQFKTDANEKGVVEKLTGNYERTGTAPIQLWQRKDGRLEVISGRHRYELAQRTGEKTIPGQIHKEEDGFTKQDAMRLDAELNIRDGQGKVKDYVNYFKATGINQQEADRRGLVGRALGRTAFGIATNGSEETVSALRNDAIKEQTALAIANAAPKDSALQAVGLKSAQEGKSDSFIVNQIKAVQLLKTDTPQETNDLFGFDDSAMKEAEALAKKATEKQSELIALRKAAKIGVKANDLQGKTQGKVEVKIKNKAELDNYISGLDNQIRAWDNWHTNPELLNQLKDNTGIKFSKLVGNPPSEEKLLTSVNAIGGNTPKKQYTETDLFVNSEEEQQALVAKQQAFNLSTTKDKKRNGNQADPVPLFSDNAGIAGQQDITDKVKLSKAESPQFYSQLRRSFESAPDKVFANSQQAKSWLKANAPKQGVKSDEIYWSGVEDYLDANPKASKQDVIKYLDENGVKTEDYTSKVKDLDGNETLLINNNLEFADIDNKAGIKKAIYEAVKNNYSSVAIDKSIGISNKVSDSAVSGWVEISKPDSIRNELKNNFGSELASMIPLKVVDTPVLLSLKNDKIRQEVIKSIPVNVVNILSNNNVSANDLLSNPDVVTNRLPVNVRSSVARGLASSLKLVGTRLRTTLNGGLSLESARGKQKDNPTVSARNLDLPIVVGLLSPSKFNRFNKLFGDSSSSLGAKPNSRAFIGAESPLTTPTLIGESPKFGSADFAKFLNSHPDYKNVSLSNINNSTSNQDNNKFLNEISEKFGGQIGTIKLDTGNQPALIITPEMKAKILGEGVPLFSHSQTKKATGSTRAQVESWLDSKDKTLLKSGRLNIAETKSEIPKGLVSIDADGVEGFYDPKSKQTWVVAENVSKDTIRSVLNHEYLHASLDTNPKLKDRLTKAHSDTRTIFNEVEKGIYTGKYKEVYDAALRRVDRAQTSQDDRFEEFLAYAITEHSKSPRSLPEKLAKAIQNIIATIKVAIFKHTGYIGKISPADLTALARSYANSSGIPNSSSKTQFSQNKEKIKINGKERWAINNEGKPIAQDDESINNFHKWFGDSKVVDDEGKPLVVYHGTQSDFDEFNLNKGMSGAITGNPIAKYGFFFSDKKNTASDYATNSKAGSNVIPSYLSLKNPYEMDMWRDFAKFSNKKGIVQDDLIKPFIDKLKAKNHDGIILKGGENYRELMVFSPNQIKSAIGNQGTFSKDSNDIRFSIKDDIKELASKKNKDTFIYYLQNKFIDFNRQAEKVIKNGGIISEPENFTVAEELYHKRLAQRIEDFRNDELSPVLQGLNKYKIGMKEFQNYLLARHAPSRNKVMSERNPNQAMIDAKMAQYEAEAQSATDPKDISEAQKMVDMWKRVQPFDGTEDQRNSLSGMSNQEASDYLDSIKNKTPYDELAKLVDKITEKTLQLQVEYGLEKQETIDQLKSQWDFYVPTYRDEAHPDEHMAIGQGFNVRGSSFKNAVGSNAEVTNILAHIMEQREVALTRGEKNRVQLRLGEFIKKHPDPDFAKIGKVKVQKKIVNGVVQKIISPNYYNQPNVLVFRDNGKNVSIEFNERNDNALRLASSLKNIDDSTLSMVDTIIAKGTRLLAAMNTQYNIVFGAFNLMRDASGGLLNLTTTPIANKKAEVAKNIPKVMKTIWDAERGKANNSVFYKRYMEFKRAGGTTGYRDMFTDIKDRNDFIEKELKKPGRNKALLAKDYVAKWLSDYNTVMENTVRFSAYNSAIESGLSKDVAASIAKNLTVNFNRKGAATTGIGAWYAFFNASAQGTARMYETLTGPSGKKIIAGGVALGVAQTLIGIAAMGDDDWEKIPEYIRERSLIIPDPVNDGKYIAIPLPLGFHILPNIGRKLVEGAFGSSRVTPQARLGTLIEEIIDAYNPLGGKDIGQTITPTVADPIAALWRNRDWTGKTIYREDFSQLDPTPGFTRKKDTATWAATKAAEIANKATGGTNYRPGLFSPTPDQIDYVFGQLGGGTWREIQNLQQAVVSTAKGEELPQRKIPLIGRIYGETKGNYAERDLFYQNIKLLNEHHNEIEGLKKEPQGKIKVNEYLTKNKEASLYEKMKTSKKMVDKLYKNKKLAKSNDEIKRIDNKIGVIMKRFNDSVLSRM